MRLPLAAKIALQRAGANGGTGIIVMPTPSAFGAPGCDTIEHHVGRAAAHGELMGPGQLGLTQRKTGAVAGARFAFKFVA
jgi:hypothetical protein